ncbi:hypothetical protein NHX12_007341 [Muraenolepis orangiensis]|uniref:Uncharacterized protein n=1 Tax=Muraenolepis orangiensis TaxID=630683 RepID=A0A9Q0IBV3_9TELE|nr:hypothetical protein NHX12_007341 [Muraenolepis orangiensis]
MQSTEKLVESHAIVAMEWTTDQRTVDLKKQSATSVREEDTSQEHAKAMLLSRRQATFPTLPSMVTIATIARQMEDSTNTSSKEETIACRQGAWQDIDTGQTVDRGGTELLQWMRVQVMW